MPEALRYRIGRLIKRGGVAEVLEAFVVGEKGFERKVALKRLLETTSEDEGFINAFIDEARIASRLHHSNIVSVFDFGILSGAPFLIMELVDGPDLLGLEEAAAAKSLSIPEDVALHIAAEVAHALAYAHASNDERGVPLGIVHRDVTPGNVLVSWVGDIKLTDFGIAHARARLQSTAVGEAKGKLGYMAPEQLKGGHVDPRADIFALGCVLHRMLTGRSPVESGIEATLPADIRRIIETATRESRIERYKGALDLAAACAQAIKSRQIVDPRARVRELGGVSATE